MGKINKIILLLICVTTTFSLSAKEPEVKAKPKQGTSINTLVDLREDCAQSQRQTDLEINNVRARLFVGGDIWWNRQQGRYIVPKPPVGSGIEEVSSIFAGGVWIGGNDPSGNLKLAASTYPSDGSPDYYPGPLDPETGQIEQTTCLEWDNFFSVKGTDIKTAIKNWDFNTENGLEYSIDDVPDGLRFWPGQGNVYFEEEYSFPLPNTQAGLGAFWDQNGDAIYSPENGDFPIIDIRGCEPATRKEAKELIPDEMIFWIYNDAGNIHRETLGDIINMEVQVQAFAYATNDEINDMTFMRYKLINRAKEDIRDTYFAMWVDPDLGCSVDDYIGCDVERSLAYTYNVDELDGEGNTIECGAVNTYENTVPMVGTDYFRGPIAPKVICEDMEAGCDMHIVSVADRYNPFDYEIGDTIWIRDPNLAAGEVGDFGFELGMSSFIYANRAGEGTPAPQTIDPQTAEQYYTYLEGKWLDGTPLSIGGDGFNPGSMDFTRYAFPNSPNDGNGWSMCSEALQAGDRRTIQASGPFLLRPGAVNELIVGAVWVPNVDYPCPDILKLGAADDIAQNLFDNCFDITDGPDAPTICTVELDKEIILVLSNDIVESNNAYLSYEEPDPKAPQEVDDTLRFEGYKIFQLSSQTVSPQELNDIDKARLIAQVDVNNEATELYNWTPSRDPNADITGNQNFIWTPERQVVGENQGIRNTFRITNDAFASGDTRLINHKQYFYMAVAYAYNNFAPFNPNEPTTTQQRPYLEGRGNVRTYVAVPRPIVYETLNAQYGDGVKISRIRGVGTGGNNLDMDDNMHEIILNGTFATDNNSVIQYKEGAGPIDVKIYNPLEVRDGKFRLEIVGDHDDSASCRIADGAGWKLTNLDDGTEFFSDTDINTVNEQLITEYGFSLNVLQAEEAGSGIATDNGALSADIEYTSNETSEPIRWFTALQDESTVIPQLPGALRSMFDFILTDPTLDPQANSSDPNRDFSSLGDGFWYPFMLTGAATKETQIPYVSPAWSDGNEQEGIRPAGGNIIRDLNNVDIVMTSDKSKWSRCIVVETGNNNFVGRKRDQFDWRNDAPSVNKDGQSNVGGSSDDENSSNYVYDKGSANVSSGFGENGFSWFPGYAIDVETGKRLNIFFGENSAFDRVYSKARTHNCCVNSDLTWVENIKAELNDICSADTLNRPELLQGYYNDQCLFVRVPGTEDIARDDKIDIYNCTGELVYCINCDGSDKEQPYSILNQFEEMDAIWSCDNGMVTNTVQDPDPFKFAVGGDILYNPTDDLFSSADATDAVSFYQNIFLGGQHYIYVTRQEYDGCTSIAAGFENALIPFFAKQEQLPAVTWTSMSYLAPGQEILSYEEGIVPGDVTMKLRVDKPYNKETLIDLEFAGSKCNVVEGELGGMPVYEFEISGSEANGLEEDDYVGALSNVNVVPNPYYAYSAYETDQFTKTVKITNLPDRAIVTIYSLDGKFIKRFDRAETVMSKRGSNPGVQFSQTSPALEWDLENTAGIPVASGVYLINVSAPRLNASGNQIGVDERTIKWFGINRKFDPSGL